MRCDKNTCLCVRVRSLSIALFRETLERHLENWTRNQSRTVYIRHQRFNNHGILQNKMGSSCNSFLQLCETEATKKEPLTSNMIKSWLAKYGWKNSSIAGLRLLLTCLLGFVGFLRIKELLEFKLKHIKIKDSHLEISIQKSKTDQHT